MGSNRLVKPPHFVQYLFKEAVKKFVTLELSVLREESYCSVAHYFLELLTKQLVPPQLSDQTLGRVLDFLFPFLGTRFHFFFLCMMIRSPLNTELQTSEGLIE